jgi:signal transduction histidine kinase
MTMMQRVPPIALGLLAVLVIAEVTTEPITIANVLGAVAALAALGLMRSFPFIGALLAAASLAIATADGRASIAALAVLVVTVGVIGFRGPNRLTTVAATAGLAACIATIVLDDNVSIAEGSQPMLLVVLVAFGGWVVGREMQRRGEVEELRFANQLAVARSELARDVHDVTSHALMAVLAQLRVGRRGLDNVDLVMAERGFGQAEAVVKDAIADLRSLTLIVAGGPAPLAACATLGQVYAQIAQAGANFPTAIVQHDDADDEIDAQVATTAIRVVQQCLANAAAHAPGQDIAIRAERVNDHLVVASSNAACETSEPGLRMGLAIMAQRVGDIGGALTSGVANGAFHVRCELPIGGAR